MNRAWGSVKGRLCLALALVLVVAVALDPVGVTRFFLGFAYRGVLVDVERWRAWVEPNAPLFGSLKPGARFAIVEDVKDSTGVVFTRTESGITVEKTHFLRFRRVPLVLAMDPPIAAEIQILRADRDGDRLWNGLKNMARRRVLRCYRLAPREELERTGLDGLLWSFDVAPDPGAVPPFAHR